MKQNCHQLQLLIIHRNSTRREEEQKNNSMANYQDNPATIDLGRSTTFVNLQIKGIGHNCKIESIDPSTMTLSQLHQYIESQTKLPALYQRLICNGKNWATKRQPAKSVTTVEQTEEKEGQKSFGDLTLLELGMKQSTSSTTTKTIKIALMHTAAYAKDKEQIDQIMTLSNELDQIVEQQDRDDGDDKEKELLQHRLTDISCQLDSINVSSSMQLRSMRKKVLDRVDSFEKKL